MNSLVDFGLSMEENIDRIEKKITEKPLEHGIYEEALRNYSFLISREPFHPLLYRGRGHRYLSLSQFGQAAADLELATRLDPGYWKNWNYLGMINYFMGDFQRAVFYYDRALSAAGETSPYLVAMMNWKYLSLCQIAGRHSEEAQALIAHIQPEQEPAASPYKKLILLNNGKLPLEVMEKEEDEMNDLERATYGYGMAMHCYFSGDVEKARKILVNALEKSKAWFALGYIACQIERNRSFQ